MSTSTNNALDAKLPEPPDTLSTEAKHHYNKIGTDLVNAGLLTVIDAQQLLILAKQLAELEKMEQAIEVSGFTLTTARGSIIANPLMKMVNQYRTAVSHSFSKLGMTPASRLQFKLPKPQTEAEKQAEAEFNAMVAH